MMPKSKKVISRLSRYKFALNRFKSLGFVKIYSEYLADAVDGSAAQVRKDFSLFGIKGNKRGGYIIDDLLEKLNKILGKDEVRNVIIVGAGYLGTALARYKNFEHDGIKIKAVFDIDPAKLGMLGNIPILTIDKMGAFVSDNNIEVGIIAVPEIAAQEALDALFSAGVCGILNFAPIQLKTVSDCIVSNVSLEVELENLIYFVHERKRRAKALEKEDK